MMCVGMALPIYGGSVLGTFMAADLHWERSALGMLIAANMTADGLAAPWVAALVGRIGTRRCLMIGCVLMGVAALALANWVDTPWQAALSFALLGVAAAFISVIPCQTAATAWFGQRRPMALGVLYAAVGIGGFIFVWLMSWSLENAAIGYRMGCWLFLGFAVLGLMVAVFIVRDTPDPVQREAWERADRARQARRRPADPVRSEALSPALVAGTNALDLRLPELLRSPALWAIYLSMFATTCGAAFVIAHAQAHLRDMGHSAMAAAGTISIVSAALVFGNIGIGWIAQRIGPRRSYFAAMMLFVLGLITLVYARSSVGLYGYALIYGLGFGAVQVGPMVLLSSYWSVKALPMLTAVGLLIQTAGAALSPVAAGVYFDRYGHYEPVIVVIVVMSLVTMVLLRLIGPPQPRKHGSPADGNTGGVSDAQPSH